MELTSNVKIKDGAWSLIPWLSNNTCTAIYPNVYLPKRIYEDLKSENPNPYNVAVLLHEQRHINRCKEIGVAKWITKYIFDSKFRVDEELLAITESMKFIKSKKLTWNIDKSAKWLSSWIYLWPISYDSVKLKLENILNNL